MGIEICLYPESNILVYKIGKKKINYTQTIRLFFLWPRKYIFFLLAGFNNIRISLFYNNYLKKHL